jgi:hypothetical protein
MERMRGAGDVLLAVAEPRKLALKEERQHPSFPNRDLLLQEEREP